MNTRFLTVAALLALAACKSQAGAPAGTQPAQVDPKAAAAKFDGVTITNAEVDEHAKDGLKKMDLDYLKGRHELRRQSLDDLIIRKILAKKIGKPEVTDQDLQEFLGKEVAKRTPDPTDVEIQAVYDQAKASGRQVPPLDAAVKAQIAQGLKGRRMQSEADAYMAELKKDAKVEVLIPAFTMPVKVDGGMEKGSKNAKVTIVEFSDFECPFCAQAEPTVKQILGAYGDKVRLVYMDFPLEFHKRAPKASEAAHCAGDQSKYWEMHERLFSSRKIDIPDLKAHAKDLGLDTAKFDKCLDSGEKAKVVEKFKKQGEENGVSSTPAFFINGRPVAGALPFEEFKKIIDEELAKS
ncbi:MAG: DsbA family protein [Anaeromyxobacter sp.]